jgi:hypothetical protein
MVAHVAGGGEKAATTGRFEILSTPTGAHVFVNNVPLSDPTPVFYESAAAGESYEIKLTLPGYKPETRKATMPASGGRHQVLVSLERIRVSLRVETEPPGASVYLNGNPRGSAPVTLEDLDPDDATTVEVRKKGFTPVFRELTWGSEERTKELRLTLDGGKK